MNAKRILACLAGVVLLAACSEQPSREAVGTGAGAVLGGVIGEKVGDGATGALIGGVLGAVLGREAARRLGPEDEQKAVNAIESNRTESWTDPETGKQITVNPTETFTRDGRTCRRYTTTIRIEGEPKEATGVACKNDAGQWQVVS